MTIKTAKRARDLLQHRDELEEFLHIYEDNYDSEMYVCVSSFHNDNRKVYIEKKLDLPLDIKQLIFEHVKTSVEVIDRELSELA